MGTTLRYRLTAFALAIGVAFIALGWAAHLTWTVVNQLQDKFYRVSGESFQIADHFHATLVGLDYTLLRYIAQDNPADWQQFQTTGAQLDRWIDDQRPLLTTQAERDILDQINRVYDLYLSAAKIVADKNRADPSIDASVKEFKQVESESKKLIDLGNSLAIAHRESLTLLSHQSEGLLQRLRRLIFLALLVLMALCGWLAAVVYREMITPLRLKLVESHAIIERQEKLASLGVLAAGVAHEIRNPLTAIKARLFTLRRTAETGTPEADDLALIDREINRLEKIVRSFLQFARPAEPKFDRVEISVLIRETAELLTPQLKARSIELRLLPCPAVTIHGDAEQLKQVLINLIQNASDSIADKGIVTLRSYQTTSRLPGGSKPTVIIEVEDSGKGIHPDIQKRLFDPFFTTKDHGTGLGLAIAARIVEKHGGALEFQTQLNHGTTFGIILPVAAK